MPRKKLFRCADFPYHVTARCNNREPFPCPLGYVWKVLVDELNIQIIRHEVRIHAFVVMPNHFHLMLTTPEGNLDVVMQEFMSSTTRIVNMKSQRTGHLYGSRYYWSLITNPLYFAHAKKYVYRNPVKADLCTKVEDYAFSTFSGIVGSTKALLKLSSPSKPLNQLVPDDLFEQLAWLNQSYETEESEAIRRALRKKTFEFSVDRRTRKPHRIANEL
jgi:putative transposase